MGILKVGAGALKSVLEDQWREYFYCPSMEADVLVKKGENRKSKRSYNTKGSDNLISNGSIIAVNEGQCMMIVDQGAIVEVCAEAGEFVYDTSAEPSIFYGNLGKSIGDSFKQFGKRFTMGASTWTSRSAATANILTEWWIRSSSIRTSVEISRKITREIRSIPSSAASF